MLRGWFLVLGLLTFAIGCGGGDAPPASIEATETAKDAPNSEPPDAVVTAFLESLRKGNDSLAASLLTDKARAETQAKGLNVQPPGTPDMTYQIGQTEYVDDTKTGAHVGSIWFEKLETGETASFEVIWVLRREAQGWRIAGMAMPPEGPESAPLFLNFEDCEDLLRKWQESEAGLAENSEKTPPETVPVEGVEKTANEGDFNPLR
jgi:hypothetical protein